MSFAYKSLHIKVTYLELHRTQLIEDIAHTVPNDIPCDFVI